MADQSTPPPISVHSEIQEAAIAEFERAEKWKTRAMCPHTHVVWKAASVTIAGVSVWTHVCQDCGMCWTAGWDPSQMRAEDDDLLTDEDLNHLTDD